jgi:hypothetical protein
LSDSRGDRPAEVDPRRSVSRLRRGQNSAQLAPTPAARPGSCRQRDEAGDGYRSPTGVPHSGANGLAQSVIVATYVVEKGKPLASPA